MMKQQLQGLSLTPGTWKILRSGAEVQKTKKQGVSNFGFMCRNGDTLMLITFSKTKHIFTTK